MERLSAVMVAKATILLVLVALLNTAQLSMSRSSPSVEDSTHYCGKFDGEGEDGGWGLCDPGRCCGKDLHCGKGNCAPDRCLYYCPPTTPFGTDDEGGVQVLAGGLTNATHNQYYLDRGEIINGDGIADRTTMINLDANASSSSSSELLSCAPYLSRLSLPASQRYPWAALGVDASRGINVTTVCGQCLKVRNVGAEDDGVQAEVKVRIVHLLETEGLKLDRNTFLELDTDHYDRELMVKYQFESC